MVKRDCFRFPRDKSSERVFVQVSYLLGSEETREREFGALEAVRSTGRKLLLTMDRLDMGDGLVEHRYIPDFLLEDSQ